MKKNIYHKYELTEKQEENLWENCFFIFDSSALLALYFYPETTRQKIYTEIFKTIKTRLWIPNHVLFEFYKNKEQKIRKAYQDNYEPLTKKYIEPIDKKITEIQNLRNQLKDITKKPDKHPFIESKEIEKFEKHSLKFKKAFDEFNENYIKKINEKIDEIKDLEKNDTVISNIENFFKVGKEYSFKEIYSITLEGKHRYQSKIPPGYYDDEKKPKEGIQKFGDLIIWKQILEFVKEENKNVIFITNDLTNDWCNLDENSNSKRIKSPRFELIKEYADYSSGLFWMYNSEQFIYNANKYLKSSFTDEQIKPISNLLEIKQDKELYGVIPIDETWNLNHWGSNCAKIINNKMVFNGISAPKGTDGSHKDLIRFLDVGAKYEISCFAKSSEETKGKLQLWCHDKTAGSTGTNVSTEYKTPSVKGEYISLIFEAKYNQNIRIHLQYKPDIGQIEVDEIKIYKLI